MPAVVCADNPARMFVDDHRPSCDCNFVSHDAGFPLSSPTEKLENLRCCRLPGVERLIGFLLLLVGPVLGLHRMLLLRKYLRCRSHVLNVFRLGYACGSAMGAVLWAAPLPDTGSGIPFRNLNFPNGNSLPQNGMTTFLANFPERDRAVAVR